jgi:hypothetical protein
MKVYKNKTAAAKALKKTKPGSFVFYVVPMGYHAKD